MGGINSCLGLQDGGGQCYSWVVSLVWPTKREHAMGCDMVAHLSINWLLWSIFLFVYRVFDGWWWLWRKERKRMRTAKEATTIGCSLFIIRALSCNKLRFYRNVVAVPLLLLLLLLPMPRSLYGTYLWVMCTGWLTESFDLYNGIL